MKSKQSCAGYIKVFLFNENNATAGWNIEKIRQKTIFSTLKVSKITLDQVVHAHHRDHYESISHVVESQITFRTL